MEKDQFCILVLDDSEDLIEVTSLILKKAGYKVATCQSAVNLLDIVASCTPQLVLMDINMDYVPGDYICWLFRNNASTADIPVLLFSAHDEIETVAGRCMANGFIRKPFESNTLLQTIESFRNG